MINYDVPVEEYNGVSVARGDLQGDGDILPPWGKLAAIENVLVNGNIPRDKPIIQLSVRGSYSGWALGVLGPIHGYKIQVAYPNAKNFPKSMVKKLESLPIELVPQRPNMMSVVLGQTKKYAKENDLQMIPYGFEHQSYLDWWAEEIKKYDYDNLIVCAGAPVTCLGMIKNFTGNKIYLVATSAQATVEKKLKKYGIEDSRIEIHTSPFDFYDEMEWLETPFPCNPNWDKKVWHWIENNTDKLEGSSLFYNLGA